MKEIGEKLKAAREEHGVSVDEAAEDLNLRASQIENIEKGNLKVFKDVFYLKSFIRSYAKYLGLDEDDIGKFNDKNINIGNVNVGMIQTLTSVKRGKNIERKNLAIPVKQALASITVKGEFQSLKDEPELLQLIKDELNVEDVFFAEGPESVVYDIVITADLKDKGRARES